MTNSFIDNEGPRIEPLEQALVRERVAASLRRRHRQEKVFKSVGLIAVLISLALVALLFINIFSKGLPAFWQTSITVDVYFDPEIIDVSPKPTRQAGEATADFRERMLDWETEVGQANFSRILTNALMPVLPGADQGSNQRHVLRMVTSGERF